MLKKYQHAVLFFLTLAAFAAFFFRNPVFAVLLFPQ